MVNFLFFLTLGLRGVAEESVRPDFHDPVALKGIIAKAVQLEAVKKADGSMQYLEPLELSSYQGSGWGVVYHENRKLRFLAQFKNGKVNGFSFSCYPSGQAMAEAYVIDGKPEGLQVSWFGNGLKSSEANFKDGRLEGLSAFWYESGRPKAELKYKDGQLDGPSTDWYGNGFKKE